MIRRRSLVAAMLLVTALEARATAQCESHQLVAPVASTDAYFGAAVALHNGVAVVGQENALFGTAPSWVFEGFGFFDAGSPLPPGQAVSSYGHSVGVWGATAVVAGQEINDPGLGATVFQWVGGAWVQSAKLYVPDLVPQVSPGLSVAIEGDTIVVADRHLNAAYVFERGPGGWLPTQTLAPATLGFGVSVSLRNGRAVVGGCVPDGSGGCDGSAWVFVKQGGLFVEVAHLVTLDPQQNGLAGYVIAQSDDAIVLGAPNHGLGFPMTGIGAAYVFERIGGVWVQTDFVTAPGPQFGDAFGSSVAMQDDLLVVGAPNRDGPAQDAGAALFYRRIGTAWHYIATLRASEPLAFGRFGMSLAIDGDMLLAGAQVGPTPGPEGCVYVARGMQGLTDWLPAGGAVAGEGAPCSFGVGTPAVGAPASVELVGALPNAPGWLVLGIGQINAPFKGGVMVPAPQLLVPLITDGAGADSFFWIWPPNLPNGLVLSLQHWIVDAGAPFGLAGAGALVVRVP